MNEGEFASSGTAMTERESLERIREGLLLAADGASHLAYHQADARWGVICATIDSIRMDGKETQIVHASKMTLIAAYTRHLDGLKQAAGGARQMAVYHRVDTRWLKLAHVIEAMQTKASELARRKQSVIRLPTVPRFQLQ